MGEKDAAKKDDGSVTVVMKVDMHCEKCAKKIKGTVRSFSGVEDMKADVENGKLTVTGKMDPKKLVQRIEDKTHKKVEILSPQPKKDAAAAGGGDKKAEDNKKSGEPKADDKKPKEPAVSTVVLKFPAACMCDGCKNKIKRAVSKIKGVDSVTVNGEGKLATVKGTMDVKEITPYLKAKLKQDVEIVPPKKEGGGKEGGGDKKGKEGGGDKKEKEGGGESKATSKGEDGKKSEEPKVEVNKMDYYGNFASSSSSYYNPPMHHQGYMDQGYGVPVYNHGYGAPAYNPGYVNPGYSQGYPSQGYPNQGYALEYSHPPPPPPPPSYLQPQMFSDENPNACSVM
ncbi:hypothetical protein Vadar_025050 [Vaccinium darrowii]|uniref:Uncharacterized protein n=1 Tax=Vaccinium darrowii TaxID=229202 RepID=A0ACB7XUF6_9ERIC|nr:hypothetical protein Vadar_025050 [Vaccinium darrowii]